MSKKPEDEADLSRKAKGRPKTKDALPVDAALAMLERRDLERAIRREGEPESPAGAHQPTEVEVHAGTMKFHCRCGKRISVPVETKKTIGRCPKCDGRIVIPKPSAARHAKAPPAEAGSRDGSRDEARAMKARRAAAEVADRLRKGKATKKLSLEPASDESKATRPGWVARVVAVQIDAAVLAAAYFGAFFLLKGMGLEWTSLAWAGVFAAAVWTGNRVVMQWADGSSFGMKLAGVRLTAHDGGRAGFGATVLRAFLGALLVPLSPLALADAEGRTPADRAAGTALVQRRV